MPARKTKSFSRKEVSLPLLLTLGGLGVLTLVYASGFFSLTTASNAGSIQANDRVTVDGVNNTTQYLTSMVLHAPGTNEKVTLNYDPALNALRIKGAVNADGLIIGNNEASVGNTILGGTNNQATQGTNTNSLIVGGESNKLNNASNSAIIGGQNNTLLNTENVAVIGSSQTTFPFDGEKKENVFVVGGVGNQVKGSNVFILGEGQNVAGSDMVLMGKRINAWEKGQLFVWSDSDEDQDFFPQRSNAFYVNTTKGIGLNTNDPKVKFDAGQAGGVRIGITASLVNNCSPSYAGVMAYVHVGGKSGFCGCNGQTWVPLTADPSIQAVCINMQKSPCAGSQPLNANKGAEIHLPLWDPNANNGDGAFMPKNWMYTNASPKAECTYDCQIGYHPGQNNPEGKHLDGACKACSSIDRRYTAGAHNGWKTAGKGNDDCDFSCVGGSFYKNTASQRACPLCSTGKSVATLVSKISGNTHYDKAWYSPDDNQLATCSECTNKPVNAKYTQKDVNSATGACPWECADGYNKRGNDCLKATWQEKRTRICRNSGKWKDAYDEVAYECRDTSGGLVNDTRICNIWWAKPADRNSNVSDSSCNEPSWTTRECDASNCSGKCNGDTVSVQCRREYRDWYGTVYNRETKSESRQCYGACEGGVCNPSVNGLNVSWTDWSWPSNTTLCSYGTVIEKNFNTNPNVYLNKWSWKCRGHSSTTPVSCAAHKPNTNAWRCDQNRINSCVKLGEPNPKAGIPVSGFENGKQWKCENEGNISDVYCTKCNDGYLGTVYDQNQPAQCVKPVQNVKVCFNPQGYREHNGWTSCMWLLRKCIDHPKWEKLNLVGRRDSDPNRDAQFAKSKLKGWMLDSESRIALGMSQFANLTNGEREITPTVDVELCALYHPWQCIGTPPQNAHLAFPGLSDYGLSDDVQISLVQTPQRHKKCEYVCNDGYKYTVWSNGVPYCKPQCTGPTPDNATLINWDDQGLTEATEIKLVTSNTAAKCEYMCKPGFTLDNGACVKQEELKRCTDIPTNAEFYTGDDKNLSSDLESVYSTSNTSRKCEWKCED